MRQPESAYLIVICDKETNAILGTEIWSSPEWEQSRCLDMPTYVAYEVKHDTYAKARERMLEIIADPRCRYHNLYHLRSERELRT